MTDDEGETENLTRNSGKGMESDLDSDSDELAEGSVPSGYGDTDDGDEESDDE